MFGFVCIYCAQLLSPVAMRDMTKPWNFWAMEKTCLPSAPNHIPGNTEVKNTVLCGLWTIISTAYLLSVWDFSFGSQQLSGSAGVHPITLCEQEIQTHSECWHGLINTAFVLWLHKLDYIILPILFLKAASNTYRNGSYLISTDLTLGLSVHCNSEHFQIFTEVTSWIFLTKWK